MDSLYEFVKSSLHEKERRVELSRGAYSARTLSENVFARNVQKLNSEINQMKLDLDVLDSGNVTEDYLNVMKRRYSFGA